MFFFNLTLIEFMGLLAGLSGVVTALYLLDRTRVRHKVATLRFWTHSDAPSEMQHRRRIQQPWSLLLQLLAIALLLLALAQLKWGSRFSTTRDHVLVLDTSSVMGTEEGNLIWMDQARRSAQAWLKKVPSGDRVMLVRADALPTAATSFESNLQVVDEAIAASRPTPSALRLDAALRFARDAQRMHSRHAGEIVYAGAGRTAEEQDENFVASLENLRVLPVEGRFENVGIRKMGLRRSSKNENIWDVYVTVGNDGETGKVVPVGLFFGSALTGQRTLNIPAGSEQSFTLELRTEAAGLLETRLQINDSFPDDNQAVLELPSQDPLKVVVYSSVANLLRPIFSHPRFNVDYRSPSEYRPDVDAAVVVLDRMSVESPQTASAIWIDPPRAGSPVSVASSRENVQLTQWHNENPWGAGLRTRDIRLNRTSVFTAEAGDVPVADVAAGPVILARPSKKFVVLGFHPMLTPLRFELATPLLFANILRSLVPDAFLQWELNAEAAGSIVAQLDEVPQGALRVTMDGGEAIPYTVDGQTLRFFSGAPGIVRVVDGKREMVYSLTIPEVGKSVWNIPDHVRKGIPASIPGAPVAQDLWQWLAIAGAICLVAEWVLFGKARRLFRFRSSFRKEAPLRKAS